MFNPNKVIKSLKGESMVKSFPSQREVSLLPKKEDGTLDYSKLGEETVGNVVLNCLGYYTPTDKKEGFYINQIANLIISFDPSKEGIEFKDKIKNFLIDVLDSAIVNNEKTKNEEGKEVDNQKGIYSAWSIAMIKEDLGFVFDEE